jgi:uncharacterized membrane protein YkvA (DUF1232 family)
MLQTLRRWARSLKRQALVVWLVARDPHTPGYVRLLALAVAAYAFSPIDLIPDMIPVLGYIDDLILVPLGVALVVRLTPPGVLAAASARAHILAQRPVSWAAAAVIGGCWALALWWCWGLLAGWSGFSAA